MKNPPLQLLHVNAVKIINLAENMNETFNQKSNEGIDGFNHRRTHLELAIMAGLKDLYILGYLSAKEELKETITTLSSDSFQQELIKPILLWKVDYKIKFDSAILVKVFEQHKEPTLKEIERYFKDTYGSTPIYGFKRNWIKGEDFLLWNESLQPKEWVIQYRVKKESKLEKFVIKQVIEPTPNEIEKYLLHSFGLKDVYSYSRSWCNDSMVSKPKKEWIVQYKRNVESPLLKQIIEQIIEPTIPEILQYFKDNLELDNLYWFQRTWTNDFLNEEALPKTEWKVKFKVIENSFIKEKIFYSNEPPTIEEIQKDFDLIYGENKVYGFARTWTDDVLEPKRK